jgi:hypothetical protein
MSGEFNYQPLTEPDAIRLIELQPSSDPSASTQCSLIYTTLSSCDIHDIFSNYTALSYVWGSEQKTSTIWIDKAPLKITANLFSALRDLRDETRAFLLWADGICINQSDNEEKSLQINMMGRIYASAANTILYLGPAGTDSKECYCLNTVRQGQPLTSTDVDVWLHSIFSKEWFGRVWVFQELVFSRNPWLQCGRTRVKWKTIYNALQPKALQQGLLDSSQNQKYRIFSEMQAAWDGHHETGKKNNMMELLQARRGLGVSDPRDMVFAHVGFADDGWHEALAVDYSKTCAQVYTDFARYLDKKYGRLDLLERIEEKKNSRACLEKLPSWVPDWTAPLEPLATKRFPLFRNIASVRGDKFWVEGLEIPVCRVAYSDTVLFTSSELSLSKIPSDIRQDIAGVASKLVEMDVLLAGSEIVFESGDRSIVLEVWPKVYQLWREVILDDDILPPKLEEMHFEQGGLVLSVHMYLILAFHPNAAANFIDGRVLAKTSSGKLALVPRSTQEGDLITFVANSRRGSKEFVFRQFQLSDDDSMGLDVRILESPGMRVRSTSNIASELVKHCTVVGECLRDRFYLETTILSNIYGTPRPFVMALH